DADGIPAAAGAARTKGPHAEPPAAAGEGLGGRGAGRGQDPDAHGGHARAAPSFEARRGGWLDPDGPGVRVPPQDPRRSGVGGGKRRRQGPIMRLRIHHVLFAGFAGVVGLLVGLTLALVGSGLTRELKATFRADVERQLALGAALVERSV